MNQSLFNAKYISSSIPLQGYKRVSRFPMISCYKTDISLLCLAEASKFGWDLFFLRVIEVKQMSRFSWRTWAGFSIPVHYDLSLSPDTSLLILHHNLHLRRIHSFWSIQLPQFIGSSFPLGHDYYGQHFAQSDQWEKKDKIENRFKDLFFIRRLRYYSNSMHHFLKWRSLACYKKRIWVTWRQVGTCQTRRRHCPDVSRHM